MTDHIPKTVDDIFRDFQARRKGLLKALSDDVDDFYQQCNPARDNLCLYGESDGRWSVDLPAEEVPPELPEPCLGINFARDGMERKDWLALIAVHSDSWLMAVAFYYAVRLDAAGRLRLFKNINQLPTLFELVTDRRRQNKSTAPSKRKKPEPSTVSAAHHENVAQASESPLAAGRLLQYTDIPTLKGHKAELFWPDDQLWYLVEIQSVNLKAKTAKVVYTNGEVEEMDLDEIIREGHMSIIP